MHTTEQSAASPGTARGRVEIERLALPWWVNALDACALAFLVLAGLAITGNGTRFTVGPMLISLLTPQRLIAWAAVAVLIRHLAHRRMPLTGRIRGWYEALGRRVERWPSLAGALPSFVVSRAAVLLVGYFAVSMIGFPAGVPGWRLSENELLNLPARWDAGWYVQVARDGYHWNGTTQQGTLAFFPAYPMLIRAGVWACGSIAVAVFIIPLVAFFLGLAYLFRLAREDLPPAAAREALLLLAFYPLRSSTAPDTPSHCSFWRRSAACTTSDAANGCARRPGVSPPA